MKYGGFRKWNGDYVGLKILIYQTIFSTYLIAEKYFHFIGFTFMAFNCSTTQAFMDRLNRKKLLVLEFPCVDC